MMLVIDIGNSFVKWKSWGPAGVIGRGRLPVDADMTAAFAGMADNQKMQLVLGSVANRQVELVLQQLFAGRIRRVITVASGLGVSNAYVDPEKLGVDRWAALVEAFCQSEKRACCVFDLGTAATLDVVDDEGFHQGGFIVPGLQMMKSSLLKSTERVRFDLHKPTLHSVYYGQNTAEAVHCGVEGMIRAWLVEEIRRFRSEYPGAVVWLTGGDGRQFAATLAVENVKYCPDLVVDGLRRMAIAG